MAQPLTRHRFLKTTATGLVGLAAAGCTRRTVRRMDEGEEVDLSDTWTDQDSRQVADTMVADMLSFDWIETWRTRRREQGLDQREPVVLIQEVRNLSHEQIPVGTFLNDITRAGTRSGEVRFVVGGQQREAIRAERAQQVEFARGDTVAEQQAETGAAFVMTGEINSTVQESGRNRQVTYIVDLRLVDIATNEEVWQGRETIRKFQRDRFLGIF